MRLAPAALALLLCACGTLSLGEAEIPEICHDLTPIDVPPAPPGPKGTFESRSPLEIPSDLIGVPGASELELTLLRVVLSAQGVNDLGFVDELDLAVLTSGDRIKVASYERTTAAPREIVLVPETALDMAALSAGGGAELDAEITGSLPTSPWTLLPRACYGARAELNWPAQ
jgi:hypothetical protein